MRIVFLATATAFALCIAPGAEAKYSLCNKTSFTLSAAMGYVDGDRLATRGWWRLRPGQCKVVLTEPTNAGRYFVYAESIPGHRGQTRSWSGETKLCVEKSGFFNLRNQDVCRDDPARTRSFFDVEVTPAANGNWQTDFAEAANFTVYTAQVAGVQRLLQDINKSNASPDGTLGKETQRAIVAYRKEKSLPDSDKVDEALIDSLIEEANAKDEKLGFFFCNRTEAPVWSAIAIPESDTVYKSRGWWKLAPNDCAKIIKGELAKDHYYVYGLIEGQGGSERRLAGGDRKFCVNAVLFEFKSDQSCADMDVEEAIFRRVNVGGASSATFEFQGDMFVGPPTE
jgi:uncharacterized membrane protein